MDFDWHKAMTMKQKWGIGWIATGVGTSHYFTKNGEHRGL